jgi:hypothetical protein
MDNVFIVNAKCNECPPLKSDQEVLRSDGRRPQTWKYGMQYHLGENIEWDSQDGEWLDSNPGPDG